MRRARALGAVAAALLALGTAVVAGGAARAAQGPFYLVPSPTKECQNVANCEAEVGPWVAVPAHGEATYLLGCPQRRGFAVGGTDARASSPATRVWFEGQLGPSTGLPAIGNPTGAAVLFHAIALDGKEAAFQPILGCVSLRSESRVATVSLVRPAASPPGVPAGAPLNLRSYNSQIGPQYRSVGAIGCSRGERLVGSWSAFAVDTISPPEPGFLRSVTVTTRVARDAVVARFQIAPPALAPIAPTSWVQLGAMCAS